MRLFKSMKFILSVSMFVMFMGISLASFSQLVLPRPLDGGAPGTGGLGDPPEVPVDGGLTLVLAAGAGYGAKKLRQYKKRKESL
jgi:hypothetical protein